MDALNEIAIGGRLRDQQETLCKGPVCNGFYVSLVIENVSTILRISYTPSSVVAGMAKFSEPELMTGGNKYDCPAKRCGSKQDAILIRNYQGSPDHILVIKRFGQDSQGNVI